MTSQGQHNVLANPWKLLNTVSLEFRPTDWKRNLISWQTLYRVPKNHKRRLKAICHRPPIPSDQTRSVSSHCPQVIVPCAHAFSFPECIIGWIAVFDPYMTRLLNEENHHYHHLVSDEGEWAAWILIHVYMMIAMCIDFTIYKECKLWEL